MIETILSYGSAIIIAIAAICTLVTVITELTKETGFLKKVPTVLQVVVLSELICIVTFFAALSYFNIAFVWYYLVAVIFAALIVAFICTHGWDALIEIFKRYNRKDMEV